jgi:hypothetical protein
VVAETAMKNEKLKMKNAKRKQERSGLNLLL